MGGKILRRIEKDLEERIRGAREILFFLDYDGTLTPIRKRPALARLHPNTRALLEALAAETWAKVFIISGRSLRDVRGLVKVPSLYYIGNHGLELEGPDLCFVHPRARAMKPVIQRCRRHLQRRLRAKGVFVEDKRFTLSIHYRLADQKKIPGIRDVLYDTTRDVRSGKKVKITTGKKVFELRPDILWDKGKIVHWVLEKTRSRRALSIGIGDDMTDEDLFRALGKRGLSIVVSKNARATQATYRLRSAREAVAFLGRVLTLRRSGTRTGRKIQ
jgi:trehalose 6-phosphate phosphatase